MPTRKTFASWSDGVVHKAAEVEEGVKRGNGRAGAESGGNDAAGACGRIRRARGATAAPGGAKAARRGLGDGNVDAVCEASRLGALKVGLRDGEVVAEGGEREIIFEGQSDRVLQGDVELAVAYEAVEALRVLQVDWWHSAGHIRRQGIA